jgi:hypothetical protein
MTMEKIAPYYKALTAFLVPFLGSLATALVQSSDNGTEVTGSEWVQALLVALVASGAVFAVPNKDPLATHQHQSVQPPDDEDFRATGYGSGV